MDHGHGHRPDDLFDVGRFGCGDPAVWNLIVIGRRSFAVRLYQEYPSFRSRMITSDGTPSICLLLLPIELLLLPADWSFVSVSVSIFSSVPALSRRILPSGLRHVLPSDSDS